MANKLNPDFERIINKAINEYGWQEFHRDPFFVKSNGASRLIVTHAMRILPLPTDVRLVSCPMRVSTVELNTILYRIRLKLEFEREGFICLFQCFDNQIYIGDGRTLDFAKFTEVFLEYN